MDALFAGAWPNGSSRARRIGWTCFTRLSEYLIILVRHTEQLTCYLDFYAWQIVLFPVEESEANLGYWDWYWDMGNGDRSVRKDIVQ